MSTSDSGLTGELIQELTEIVFGPVISPKPCDLIFVFGGSHPGLWETAAEAYHAGLGKTILVTGGYKASAQRHSTWADGVTPEAQVIRRELLRLGVPAEAICYEDRSTNSLENVLFALEVYHFERVNSILAVCKCYGVGRQCRTLQHHIRPEISILPYPFDTAFAGSSVLVTRDTWMNDPIVAKNVIEQAGKIYRYGKKGDLCPLENPSPALLSLLNGNR